ncbi:MAG: type II toxin-antitoxin system HicB family antitoxin [Dehalococcoidia bacterium]|nr:type II toxin-antitoxin system HicB family antitoxin [Dehalococcoidia bacterium]
MTDAPIEIVRAALAAPYNRVLVREEDGSYSAEVLEFRGCYAGGSTADEAMTNLDEAIAGWIMSELDQAHEIPPPIDEENYSGRLTLRILPSLHRIAAMVAQAEGTSLNRVLAAAIAYYVGSKAAPWLASAAATNVLPDHLASTTPTYGPPQDAPTDYATPPVFVSQAQQEAWNQRRQQLGPRFRD